MSKILNFIESNGKDKKTDFSYILYVTANSLWFGLIVGLFTFLFGYCDPSQVFEVSFVSFVSIFVLFSLLATIFNNFIYNDIKSIAKKLNAKRLINGDNYDFGDYLIEKVRKASIIYSYPLPEIYVVDSDNYDIASFNRKKSDGIFVTSGLVKDLSEEEFEFFISMQFSKFISGKVKYNSDITFQYIPLTYLFALGKWITGYRRSFIKLMGYTICAFSAPAILFLKKFELHSMLSFNNSLSKVALATGIPFGIEDCFRVIDNNNSQKNIDLFILPCLSVNFDCFSGINKKEVISSIEDSSSLEIDCGVVSNFDYCIEQDLIDALSSKRGCLALYYQLLTDNIEAPANLSYKLNSYIKFDSYLLPYVTHSIVSILKDAKKDTLENMRRDFNLVYCFTSNNKLENILACNFILNSLLNRRKSDRWCGIRAALNIFKGGIINDHGDIVEAANYLRFDKSKMQELLSEIKHLRNVKVNISGIMFLLTSDIYMPITLIND